MINQLRNAQIFTCIIELYIERERERKRESSVSVILNIYIPE